TLACDRSRGTRAFGANPRFDQHPRFGQRPGAPLRAPAARTIPKATQPLPPHRRTHAPPDRPPALARGLACKIAPRALARALAADSPRALARALAIMIG
ncbi:MAG TPA: hypothetical protein VNY52_00150, partial [Solirubrobacteraceae bacterium]|nr:hypothetical protein [Solirubrobacteraceae bacterium]